MFSSASWRRRDLGELNSGSTCLLLELLVVPSLLMEVAGFDFRCTAASVRFDTVELTSGFERVLDTGMFGFGFDLVDLLLPAEWGLSCETDDNAFFRFFSDATTSFDSTSDGWDRLGAGRDCGIRCLPTEHNSNK